MALVAVAHRDKDLAVLRRGQAVVDSQLRLGVCLRVAARNAHDLARGLHLRTKHNLGAGEAAPGHDGFLHAEPVHIALIRRQVEICDLLARHNARGGLGQRHAGSLGDKGHRAAGTGIGLDNIDGLALDGVLHVYQAAHAQSQGNATRGVAQLVLQRA